MNLHALSLLEFPRLLDVVAGRAATEAGAARVRGLAPVADRGWIEAEHARVAAMRAIAESDAGWRGEPIPPLEPALHRLRVAGASWSAAELSGARTLLVSSRRTREALRDARRPAVATAVLAPFAERLIAESAIESAIDAAIAEDATVKDEASPLLRRIRRDLRAAEGELIRLLERVLRGLEAHQTVPDMSVTVRNGRYVIPIRRGARTVVGGIVHDTSQSGETLFVEPPAAIEFGNRMRELEAEALREIDRILGELTERVRPHREAMSAALEALVELDALYARARFARDFGCGAVEFADPGAGFDIRDGRHPLLVAQGTTVVPFDLAMGPDERTLLISGPNTGGKTVLLKAVGLIAAMAQAGIPVPVSGGTRLAIFDDIYADIGDEQSIEASLSTFSAHVKNLGEILRLATSRSLVLIDELGSGTDPAEGAALGGAILEELTGRGAMTLATTHLGALKQLATDRRGIVNASLQFDAVQLAPTYRLIKGIPGRSYGLSIARRLQLPEPLLRRAEERLPEGERDLAVLLAELERREAELGDREREAAAMADDARERTRRAAERERALRERERALERESRREARRYVLEARAEIERTIRELKAQGAEQLDEAARAARQRAERLAAEQGEAIDALERQEGKRQERESDVVRDGIEAGDWAEVASLGGKPGRVLDVRDGSAVVAVGGIKMTVPLSGLRRTDREPQEVAVALVGDLPEVQAAREIDVRGMRADEIESVVLAALDAAIRADLRELRIIHGKGTGALRQRVDEMLRKEVRVKGFRLGAWNEGGAGVTVVAL